MGMDIVGIKPTNSIGEYFYSNVWGWIPLWNYVAQECSDILTKRDISLGGSNSGHRISRTKATAIGKRLHNLLRLGRTQEYVKKLPRSTPSRSQAPALVAAKKVAKALGLEAQAELGVKTKLSVRSVREFADFCVASGGFEID